MVKFIERERKEISQLLELTQDASSEKKWITRIEDVLNCPRARRAKRNADWAAEDKLLGIRKRRGRPKGQGADTMQDLYCLAILYKLVTKKEIRNSRSHPFFLLAKICLRREDPSRLIERLQGDRWRWGTINSIGKMPGLGNARQVVFAAAARALKPDPE